MLLLLGVADRLRELHLAVSVNCLPRGRQVWLKQFSVCLRGLADIIVLNQLLVSKIISLIGRHSILLLSYAI